MNFPFGPLNAIEHVTSLALHLPDQGHFPVDPIVPGNPVFEVSPAAPVIQALGFQQVGELHSDWLIS